MDDEMCLIFKIIFAMSFMTSDSQSWKAAMVTRMTSGGRLNKKDGLTRYGDSHVKDKTS